MLQPQYVVFDHHIFTSRVCTLCTVYIVRRTCLHVFMIARSAWCVAHRKHCAVDGEIANIHCAGTPCTAHSTIGLQEREQARSWAHFVIWIGMRLLLQEPILIQENVPGFPRHLLVQYLPMYHWEFVVLNPLQLGWPIKRDRQWAV